MTRVGRKQKNPQSKVDRALAKLSEDDLKTWSELIRFNTNYTQLKDWLAERGHGNITPQNLSNWWSSNRPKGEAALISNAIAENHLGINADAASEMGISLMVVLANRLWQETREDIDELATETRMENLTQILKELSSAASRHGKTMRAQTRANLVELGKLEMAEKLLATFKETSFAAALEIGIDEIMAGE
jgi:hypothetical protein